MRFVAFDIESPDGFFAQGNLCEFGYTVADKNFNILTEKNLLIRPIAPITRPNYRIKLEYPLAVYNSAPRFAEHYDHIANLLSAPDTVVVGHAIHNDVFCLNCACARNTLRPINFTFIDTQILYGIYKEDKKILSLDKIADEIGGQFTHHRADEDARMSLLTLKHICEKVGLGYKELLDKYEAVPGFVCDGQISNFLSNQLANIAPSLDSKNSKRRLLSAFLPAVSAGKINEEHTLYGKKIALASDITLTNVDDARSMIQAITDVGGKYQTSLIRLDYFVTDDETYKNEEFAVIDLQTFKGLLGDYKQLEFDNKAILAKYMKERAEKKMKESFEKRYKKK